jgi:ADP-dependent NAD(P)H-hydrate dehydratase / NAD(P)H-hydrate epimerase
MLEIIEGTAVSSLDQKYIQESGISSWALMERAAAAFSTWFEKKYTHTGINIYVFCGKGNNGGDGLAIARMLWPKYPNLTLIVLADVDTASGDYQANFELLPGSLSRYRFDQFHWGINNDDIVIDCLFGVGLTRPLENEFLDVVQKINASPGYKIAIDIPSGLPADGILTSEAVKADVTFAFQFPKISLLLPEHAWYTGDLEVGDIGIPTSTFKKFSKQRYFVLADDIPSMHKTFHKFSHKGDFGRVMLIGGSKGKMGAMVLAAKAAMRTGSGFVHCLVSEELGIILQVSIPEAMVSDPTQEDDLKKYDVVAIGPGWGVEHDAKVLKGFLSSAEKSLVLDADALNLLSKFPELLEFLPDDTILTPHLKEFDRLAGGSENHLQRLKKAKDFAEKYKVVVVLKGAYTCVSCPNGNQYFNSTGNQYMGTAGSGDVLTGIIASFLGQGYPAVNAAICGVYHHGLAGETAALTKRRGLIASDIVEAIPGTFVQLDIP